jgi:hypothetical protein
MDIAFSDAKKKKGPSKEWTEKEIEEQLQKLDAKI